MRLSLEREVPTRKICGVEKLLVAAARFREQNGVHFLHLNSILRQGSLKGKRDATARMMYFGYIVHVLFIMDLQQ